MLPPPNGVTVSAAGEGMVGEIDPVPPTPNIAKRSVPGRVGLLGAGVAARVGWPSLPDPIGS